MLLHILFYYIVGSYLVGAGLLAAEIVATTHHAKLAKEAQKTTSVDLSKYINLMPHFKLMAILYVLSPFTAWHGTLHYVAWCWSQLTGKPFRPWI